MFLRTDAVNARTTNIQQLHVEDKCTVRGDHAAGARAAVAKLGRQLEAALLANAHAAQAVIPASDDVTRTKAELEGYTAFDRRVKLGAVPQTSGVMPQSQHNLTYIESMSPGCESISHVAGLCLTPMRRSVGGARATASAASVAITEPSTPSFIVLRGIYICHASVEASVL